MAQENGIVVTAYSSFGPQSFLELPPAFNKRVKNISLLFETDAIKKIASAHDITPAHVLLRWATQRNIAVIPKSNSANRLKQNLEVLDVGLTQEELDSISALDKGLRFNDPGFYLPNYPLRIFA